MTRCPFQFVGEHDTIPDPAGLLVGEVRVCQVCRLPWRVVATEPYVLAADVDTARAMLKTLGDEVARLDVVAQEQAASAAAPDQ